jgi:hypothetical protein
MSLRELSFLICRQVGTGRESKPCISPFSRIILGKKLRSKERRKYANTNNGNQ